MKLKKITPEELNKKIATNECLIFDVREVDEYNYEHIEGSINTPLSSLKEYLLDKLNVSTECIITCKSGKRAEQAASSLKSDNIYILEGGLDAWKKSNLSIVKALKEKFPTMRLVQIIAGTIVLTSTILGMINSKFLIIPIFVGAGLTFAGATGWCGMAILIEKIRK